MGSNLKEKILKVINYFNKKGARLWNMDTNILTQAENFFKWVIEAGNNSFFGRLEIKRDNNIKINKNGKEEIRYQIYLNDKVIGNKSMAWSTITQKYDVWKFFNFIDFKKSLKQSNYQNVKIEIYDSINPYYQCLYDDYENFKKDNINEEDLSKKYRSIIVPYLNRSIIQSINSDDKKMINLSFSFVLCIVYFFFKNDHSLINKVYFETNKADKNTKQKKFCMGSITGMKQITKVIDETYCISEYENNHYTKDKLEAELFDKLLNEINFNDKDVDDISFLTEKYQFIDQDDIELRKKFRENSIELRRKIMKDFDFNNYTDFNQDTISKTDIKLLEACHIYEVKEIKKELKNLEIRTNDFNKKEYIEKQNNGYNCLLLTPTLHVLFDEDIFQINKDGSIFIRNKKFQNIIYKQFFGLSNDYDLKTVKVRDELVKSKEFQDFWHKRYSESSFIK